MQTLRLMKASELMKIPEIVDRSTFVQRVASMRKNNTFSDRFHVVENDANLKYQLRCTIEGGILTYLLHW